MYKIIKKLLVTVALVVTCSLTAHADILSMTITNNSTNVYWTNAMNISNIQIVTGNTPTTNAIINFYDNNVGSNVYARAAYTNFTELATNVTSIVTNSVGDLSTNIYPGIWELPVTNAAVTAALPIVFSTVPVQNTSPSRPVALSLVKGLVITSSGTTNASVSVIVTYNAPY